MRAPTRVEGLVADALLRQAGADGVTLNRHQAHRYAKAALLGQLAAASGRAAIDGATITARGVEVLQLLPLGLTNAQIAARLFLGEETVKSHIKAVFQALGARDRAQAVYLGMVHGLIVPNASESGERAA